MAFLSCEGGVTSSACLSQSLPRSLDQFGASETPSLLKCEGIMAEEQPNPFGAKLKPRPRAVGELSAIEKEIAAAKAAEEGGGDKTAGGAAAEAAALLGA